MSALDDLLGRVVAVERGLRDGTYVRSIVEDNDAWIVDMNAEGQLYEEGRNSLGVDIMDYMPYTPYTIEIKRMKGQPTDRVTLRDTGDFESSFYITTNATEFEICASDAKTAKLIKKYGREILGLTDENIERLIEDYIRPGLLDKISEIL